MIKKKNNNNNSDVCVVDAVSLKLVNMLNMSKPCFCSFSTAQMELTAVDFPLRLFNVSDLIIQSKLFGLLKIYLLLIHLPPPLLRSKMQPSIDPSLACTV